MDRKTRGKEEYDGAAGQPCDLSFSQHRRGAALPASVAFGDQSCTMEPLNKSRFLWAKQ